MQASKDVIELLDSYTQKYNHISFIEPDPICVPHTFSMKQDIEISAFFASIFSWGNRKTIINKSFELMQLMDNSPFQFITQHKEIDLKKMLQFKHRTFNDTDLLYFIYFLNKHYQKNKSLESAFCMGNNQKERLIAFQKYFTSLENFPLRTKKHISSPISNSSCKRLNMFLRWMVRKDKNKVDFGIWKEIKASELMIPLDVHVLKVSQRLSLIDSNKSDWTQVEKLTSILKTLDPSDPVKYDFALFGLGILDKNQFTYE